VWEHDLVIYKKLIAVGCFKEPKYKTWLKKGSWNAAEAACLFNGIDIHSSSQAAMEFHHIDGFPGTKTVIVGINLISDEDNERYNLSDTDLWTANYFLDAVNIEAEAIENCRGYSDPLLLTNSYIQRNEGEILPKKLLKFAKEFFWDLYQKRNDSNFNKMDWKRCWHENISEPFLQLIADKENALLKDESAPPETKKTLDNALLKKDESAPPETNKTNEEHIVKQDKEKIKIILEESAKAREKRVRNRGLEIYRDFKEKYPNKKITKEDVARQIMQEEAALYGFISKEQPLKKQPVFGTYLKELRKGL